MTREQIIEIVANNCRTAGHAGLYGKDSYRLAKHKLSRRKR